MRKELAYGTATALLVTMVASPACAQTAHAVSGGYDPQDVLDQASVEAGAYGSEFVSPYMDDISRVSTFAMALAEGVALTAAGAEVVRQMGQIGTDGGDLDPSAGTPDPLTGTTGEYRQMPEVPISASQNQAYADSSASNDGERR